MPALLLLLALPLLACHPLIPAEEGSSPRGERPDWLRLEPGGEPLQVPVTDEPGESILVELADMSSPGYYGIELTCEAYLSVSGCVWATAAVTETDQADSRQLDAERFRVPGGYALVFEGHPEESAWLDLSIGEQGPESSGEAVAFRQVGEPIEDPYPDTDYSHPRGLSLEEGQCTGVLTAFGSAREYVEITGLAAGSIYRVRFQSENLFGLEPWYDRGLSFGGSASGPLEPTQEAGNTQVASFRCVLGAGEEEPALLGVYGELGCSYELSVEKTSDGYSDDAFEPDNGPLATTLDRIEDDGVSALMESAIHATGYSGPDWIAFRPLPDTTYSIVLAVDDALVDPSLPVAEAAPLSIGLRLVSPDGSTPARAQAYVELTRKVGGPWTADEGVEWTAPASVAGDYFVVVSPESASVPLTYHVRITPSRG